MEETLKKHGFPPFRVVLIHGGPGAAGELTPLATELSVFTSILEPYQTKSSIEELISELDEQLTLYAELPVILIGHSWGAWLGVIYASRYLQKVKKLILISSGPFESSFSADIVNVRARRLKDKDRKRLFSWIERLNDPEEKNKNDLFREVGELIYLADSFEPIRIENPDIQYNYGNYLKVWNEARELRDSSQLLIAATRIVCPVIAIHGDYDPHPAAGVKDPITARLPDFKFHLLRNCGHHPWEEKLARDEFFDILKNHILLP